MSRRSKQPAPTSHRLRNGLRVVATRTPQSGATSIALALRAGSVYDPPNAQGLAHFLEHLIFKATLDYSRQELAAALQRCGNRFDPATSKELISIMGSVPAAKADEALDLLSSVVRRPLFAAKDIETERKVVLEELRDWEDDPSKRIEVLTDEALWGSHPLGRDVGGTLATVRGISAAQVRRFHRRLFNPRNAVLSLAGPQSTRELAASAERFFGTWRAAPDAVVPPTPADALVQPAMHRARRAKTLRRSNTQQVWFSISTTTPSYPHGFDAVLQTQLAQTMIGEGDGSRLWDGLREGLGLAYEVYATQDFYSNVGVMSAMAAVGRGRAKLAVREMRRLLEETQHGFSADEFERGREAYSAQTHLISEWNAETARRYAELALFDQPLVTPAQELQRLSKLRAAEFNEFVKANIRWDSGTLCAIGTAPALEALRA
ncbi:MAG: insulinase family protein [Candidatus Eremiobacteraeota bacterium]|nr:insulinase family protein [Candidatus Eremiobacteraeota bacterium]MBV8366281.1 insulinase family protein [Candidatus Eremiobacteraeota bacterium]